MRIPGFADTSLLNSRLCRYEPFKASLTLHCAEHAPTCTYPLDKNKKISTWQEYKNIHLTRIQKYPLDKNTKISTWQEYKTASTTKIRKHDLPSSEFTFQDSSLLKPH